MSITLDNQGGVVSETIEGVTMPYDSTFTKINDWIHGHEVQFEELQALCLGLAAENDELKEEILSIRIKNRQNK